ncbi:MAG: hypothetical protein NT094_02485 [Candidatus Staskawiczbacteria bacterium]|nr:hypothetical protein [Candidatus Staskawiczbacteria bacterium]
MQRGTVVIVLNGNGQKPFLGMVIEPVGNLSAKVKSGDTTDNYPTDKLIALVQADSDELTMSSGAILARHLPEAFIALGALIYRVAGDLENHETFQH